MQIVVFDLASDISFKTAKQPLASLLDSAKLPGGHPLRRPDQFLFGGHQFATVQYEVQSGDKNGKLDPRYWAAALTLDRNYAITWLFFSDSQSGVEELVRGLVHIRSSKLLTTKPGRDRRSQNISLPHCKNAKIRFVSC